MYTYRIFPDQQLCVFTGRGNVLVDEIRETAKKMILDPNWRSDWNILYDFRDADIPQLNYLISIKNSQIDEKYYDRIKGGKVAVVADKDATYGTFRMYFSIAYERPQRVQICRSLEEASAFLELPSAFLDQL